MSNPDVYWVGYGIGSLLIFAVYLAPTIVAAVVHSRNLLAVVLVDVLLGWTVVGWIVAWVLCFSGRPQQAQAALWPQAQYGSGGLSPDGMFWWDGIAWRDTRVVAPPWAQRSPDDHWWWDGMRWRAMPPAPPR